MDFWTAFPYWAILLIVIINAWLVSRGEVCVLEESEQASDD